MRTLGNIIWHFPFCGFIRALIAALSGLFWCLTVIGIPLGLGQFQLSLFYLAPFTKSMVSQSDLELVTGDKQNVAISAWFIIIRILYFPFGLIAATGSIILIAIEFVSLVGIPIALAESKALSSIFNPVNKRCVPRFIAEEIERRKASATLSKYENNSPTQKVASPSNTSASQVQRCTNCGKEIMIGWTACPYCGSTLENVDVVQQPLSQTEQVESDHSRFTPTSGAAPETDLSQEDAKPVEPMQFSSSIETEPFADEKKKQMMIFGGAAGAVVLLGIIGYFAWYAPYAKDRDAMRTYVIASEAGVSPSDSGDMEEPLLATIPYGTEVITYSIGDKWAEVKAAGVKGYIESGYLADAKSYNILYRAWGDANTKQYIRDAVSRRAIMNYCIHAGLKTGKEDWQFLVSKTKGGFDNFVADLQTNDGLSVRSEFAFILKNNTTQERRLAVYANGYGVINPLLIHEEKAPKEGGIKDIKYNKRKKTYTVTYTKGGYAAQTVQPTMPLPTMQLVENPSEQYGMKVRITATDVNLRQAPTTDSPRLMIAYAGQTVVMYWSDQEGDVTMPIAYHIDNAVVGVVGETDEWYRISITTAAGTFYPYLMKQFAEPVEM